MSLATVTENTVTGLGYDLVDIERAPRGLLRIYIDRVPGAAGGEFITVDDCERVTRQLQHVLEVEGMAYERLEVSSPGLDRPLKKPADYQRFVGLEIDLTLKAAFQGRKKWRGILHEADATPSEGAANAAADGQAWRLVFKEGKVEQALDFELNEVKEARLVPVVDFKGKRFAAPDVDTALGQEQEEDGGHKE